MNPQDFRSLQEAYMEVVENQQLDEEKKPLPTSRMANQRRNAWNKAKDAVETGNEDERKKQISRYNAMSFPETRRSHLKSKTQKESYDIYDIILLHLLDEGYAETPEAAEAIMVNMSEEWREEIIEGEGSFGQTPKSAERYKKARRESSPIHVGNNIYKSNIRKSAQGDFASKRLSAMDDPDAGSRAERRSTLPSRDFPIFDLYILLPT